MKPFLAQQHEERSLLRAAASKLDNEQGVRIHAAAAEALIAERAPQFARLATHQKQLDSLGFLPEYGNNTPAQIIKGFDVKSAPDEVSPAQRPG